MSIIRTTLKTKGFGGLYSGCTTLIVGNSVKAGVRFVSYDKYKGMLADSEVRLLSRPSK
jgi:solute carrier family 25 citrate transporter 1